MLLQMTLGIARCASPDFCPDDQAILEAVRASDAEEAFALSQMPEYEQALIGTLPIKGISEVICGEENPAKVPTVNCKFTVHYLGYNSYQIARLTFDGHWKVEQSMEVARRR